MSFFYDLNKKLDGIRATPEVTHKQLNERDMGKHNNATTGFEALAKKAGGGEKGNKIAGAQFQKMKKAGQLEEEGMSRAAKGYEKYGKQGMEALAKAGREGKALDPVRNKFNKYDESIEEGDVPMSPKQKSFAKLAPPADKITFADKIAGAKKEVDEMLGDVAAEAMKSALSGRQKKLDKNDNGRLDATDFAMLRKGASTKKVDEVEGKVYRHKGTYGTEYDGDQDDIKAIATKKKAAAAAGQATRGRGRPKNNASADTGEVMKPDWSAFGGPVKLKPHTGKITKHKMVGEDDLDPEDQGEYDQEGEMAKDDIKTIVRHAQALQKVLGDNDNLPEWVQAKLAKIEGMMTAVDDYMQNQAGDDMDGEEEPIAEKAVSKKQQRFMGMVHATQKGEKAPSKEVSKVAKSMKKSDATDFASTKQKGLPEKAPKKNKEEDVEESTTSGSVATSAAAPKASKGSGGFTFGKGIYDSLNREVEDMIAESMSINMSDSTEGGKSLTVTATDEDAMKLAMILKSAGLGNGAAQETCSTCGGTDCGCDAVDESYGDDVVSQNSPDYPTNTEKAQNNFEYSGGLNKPKSTGQTTIPVIAGQGNRTDSYADVEQDALHRMMEMSGIREAKAKPDFLDIDKDGDKDESMKKAVNDKKTKVEESDTEFSEGIQRMREIAGIAQEGKVIDALKSGAKKVLDVVTGPDDDELLNRLDKDVHGGKVPNRYNSDSESAKKYPADSWKAKQVEESIFDLTNQWRAYKG